MASLHTPCKHQKNIRREWPNHFSATKLVGKDTNGVIDIGESGNLKNRIRAFMPFGSHSAALRYKNHKMHRVFPWEKLLIRWRYTEDKLASQEEERRLLRKYLKKHYELPPLNYKAEWKIK